MRMRQNLADLESAFHRQIEEERERAVRVRREAELRARKREVERTHKHGTMRFFALVVALILTAVVVTYAMFTTLYYVMG
jgi:membrane glycosyltransferase